MTKSFDKKTHLYQQKILTMQSKIQKNWCTVTVAPTIEHHGGHSRIPANQSWDQVPGRSRRVRLSCLASRTRHEYPRHNKGYIWRFDTGSGPTLYRKCQSHKTSGKQQLKRSITQRLRTASWIGETTFIQLVWLIGLRIQHSPQQLCNQQETQVCKSPPDCKYEK